MKRLIVIAAGLLSAVPGFAQAPSNNGCAAAITVVAGVNPSPPNGVSGTFYTNVGASDSSPLWAATCGVTPHKDVWFLYVAARTGTVTVKTCTPTGFAAGSLVDTAVGIYDAVQCSTGGSDIGCNNDSCGTRSSADFVAFGGNSYLIRVGSVSATLSGTFYLTIVEPAPNIHTSCSGAFQIDGSADAVGISFGGTTVDVSGYGCAAFSTTAHSSWWCDITPATTCELTLTLTGTATYDLAVYTGNCPVGMFNFLTPVACGGPQVALTVPATQGAVYHVRVGLAAPSTDLNVLLGISCPPEPPNDTCATALPVAGGVSPTLFMSPASFDTGGALDSTGYAATCAPIHNDVFFSYVAASSGQTEVSTLTPAGYAPGTLTNTVVAVYSDCSAATPIACNDDFGGGSLSKVSFPTAQGSTYIIRVGSPSVSQSGTFWLTITPKFALTMTSPLGLGSFQVDLTNGGANYLYFSVFTLTAGFFPYGPFFGIEPSLGEIQIQIATAMPPYVGFMDASGAMQYGPFTGLPPLTVYAVSIEFDLAGSIAGVSPPTVHTIP